SSTSRPGSSTRSNTSSCSRRAGPCRLPRGRRRVIVSRPVISLGQIEKRFGDHVVLAGAALRVEPKARIGVIGDNGAGKTTLIRILAGIEEADRGVRQ